MNQQTTECAEREEMCMGKFDYERGNNKRKQMVPFTDYYDDEDDVVVVVEKSGKILYRVLQSICQPFT